MFQYSQESILADSWLAHSPYARVFLFQYSQESILADSVPMSIEDMELIRFSTRKSRFWPIPSGGNLKMRQPAVSVLARVDFGRFACRQTIDVVSRTFQYSQESILADSAYHPSQDR